MAIYRLHRKQWETAYSVVPIRIRTATTQSATKITSLNNTTSDTSTTTSKKRSQGYDDNDTDEDEGIKEKEKYPGGGRKGMSSGLSVIVKRGKHAAIAVGRGSKGVGGKGGGDGGGEKVKWWKELGSGGGGGSKGMFKLTK